MVQKAVNHTSCILSIVSVVLLLSLAGLLFLILKDNIYQEIDSDFATGCTNVPPESHQVLSEEPVPVDCYPLPTAREDRPYHDFRLPRYIVPVHYDLLLHPYPGDHKFTGEVNITIDVGRKTRYIIVHNYDLDIYSSKVLAIQSAGELEIEKVFPFKVHQYHVVEMVEEVKPGTYSLQFGFKGQLVGHNLLGFYESLYMNSKNETRFLATSKFQPTHARKAFPCFDEPSFKSSFSISLVHSIEYVALSNMPAYATEPYRNLKTTLITKFQKTVPMVTYLAVFIVCDYHYKEAFTLSGKPFRVYAQPERMKLADYAVQIGPRIVDYLEKFLGIEFSLPKLDMIGIPQYPSSATEHWGLITYAEGSIYYDPEVDSFEKIQSITGTIAHELSHMWFGNLVTTEWWDDIWLNEGFASFIEYFPINDLYPDWDMFTQFVNLDLQRVMNIDNKGESRPVVKAINNTVDILRTFGTIVYAKGASILRMLEATVGKESFRTAISNFLLKHEFKNAKTSDLYEELSAAWGYLDNRNISSILKTWMTKNGFPYVTITRESKNPPIFIAKQTTFLDYEALHYQQPNSTEKHIWSIPLSYRTSDNHFGIQWIHDEETKFELPLAYASEWIKFNVNSTGYYMVNYDKEDWYKLAELLLTNHEALSPSDRSNLLYDSFHLAKSRVIEFDIFLSISKYLKKERHLTPWKTVKPQLENLHAMLFDENQFLIDNYIRDLTTEPFRELGFSVYSNNHLNNLLSVIVTNLACQSGNEECLLHAVESFENWTHGEKMPKQFEYLLFSSVIESSEKDRHWEYLWKRYQEEEPGRLKRDYFGYLSKTRKPYLINSFLLYGLNASQEQFSDYLYGLVNNPIGRPLVWQLITGQFPRLEERFSRKLLEDVANEISRYFNTNDQLDELKAFYAKYPPTTLHPDSQQYAIERIQNTTKRISSYSSEIQTWFAAQSSCSWYHHRLPDHIIPEHYDLLLYPMLDHDSFNGSVGIMVALQRPADCFILHSVGQNITKVELTAIDSLEKIEISKVFEYKENDYLVMKFEKKLLVGSYRLHFEFEGLMTSSLKGLYKSSYLDPVTNKRRYLATTKFEAVDARRAFPCFDEPRFKSTFRVSVIHSSDYIAISNSLVETLNEWSGDLRLTTFQNTIPIPTYLVAVVVCDFEFRETITENGIRLRIYSAPYHIEMTHYSLEMGSKILTFFENYFELPYPLQKLDMVATPDLFMYGMENWGLITFVEERLISDNATSAPTAYKQSVCGLVAHEIAHMWFGDLVTMKWWDDVWLKEGFATYVTQKGVQHAEPGLEKDDSKGTQILITTMTSDQIVNSHPVIQPVIHDTFSIYDAITYSKGSSQLRMLESYMGDDFRKGVSSYLKKHSFGSAETSDLWDSLTTVSKQGLNVSSLMDTWTKQMNFPFISIERSDENHYVIRQHRFLIDPDTRFFSEYSPYNYTWQIPLSYRTSESPEINYLLLNSSEREISLPQAEWIKFNTDFTGPYLVNYEKRDWIKFIKTLERNPTIFSPSDRMNLLFDAFSLASAGHLEYEVPLNLTRYMKHEEHHAVWGLVLNQLAGFEKYFKDDRKIEEILKEHIRSLSKDLFAKFKWNVTGDYSERKFKIRLIDAACKGGNEDCIETASYLFKYWTKGLEIDDEIKELVLKYGLKTHRDTESWEYTWNQYLKETNPMRKEIYLAVLPTVQDADLLERLMNYAQNDTLVRKHDYIPVLQNIAKNPKGLPLIRDMIFFNLSNLIQNFGFLKTIEFTKDVFSQYSTERYLDVVEEFYTKIMETKEGDKYRAEAIENILKNINWIKRNKNSVRNWLQNNVFMPWKNIRLPTNIIPNKYNITLHPNITELSIKGEVEIQLNVTENTDCVILHQKNLNVLDAELRNLAAGGVIVAIEESFKYDRNHFYVLRLRNEIDRGLYAVKLWFKGGFLDGSDGVGRYKYTHKVTGETRYLIATQFEPTYAREAFPCFDEPALKAKIELAIVHDSFHRAVSNMPEERKDVIHKGLVKTVFMETFTMSTYLLFFSVSDFEYLEADHRGINVRIYAPSDRVSDVEHALNLTLKILEKLEDMFEIPYVLPKLDSLAIPDFCVPAMENWGAIAYNSRHILTHEGMTLKDRTLHIDRVIAHEVVHQWFGNLVTMKWWSDLWLNEGFATFVMYFPLRKLYPAIEKINVRMMSTIMCKDSSPRSHPIVVNATTPDEIVNSFDAISYDKGGAVLKMLQTTLKQDFRIGISNYLKKYSYKNADTQDLWKEMTDASTKGINVTEVMDTWTTQFGFPFVEIDRKGQHITATQYWFTRNMNKFEIEKAMNETRVPSQRFIWNIPLTYKNVNTKEEHTLWFNNKTGTFMIKESAEDLIKFNPDFTGIYVVNYHQHEWARLGRRLQQNHLDFSVGDRYNLLHDAFILAETDRLSYDVPLQMTQYLVREMDSLPWKLFRDHYMNLLKHLNKETGQLLKAYVAQLTKGLYDSHSSEIETKKYFNQWRSRSLGCSFTFPDLDFLPTVVDLACHTSNEKCLKIMDQELQLWLHGQEIKSDPNLVLQLGIPRVEEDALWEVLYNQLISNETAQDRKFLLANGLASFTDPTFVKRTTDVMTSDPQISNDTALKIYLAIIRNPQAIPHLWNCAKSNWAQFVYKFEQMPNHLANLIEVFCGTFKTPQLLDELTSFMKDIPHFDKYAIEYCRNMIQEKIDWSEKYEESITTWLTWNGNLQRCYSTE